MFDSCPPQLLAERIRASSLYSSNDSVYFDAQPEILAEGDITREDVDEISETLAAPAIGPERDFEIVVCLYHYLALCIAQLRPSERLYGG